MSLRPPAVTLLTVCVVALAACGATARGRPGLRPAAATPAHWTAGRRLARPLDAVASGSRGATIIAAAGVLLRVSESGRVSRFAPAYRSPAGEEPYIASPAPGHRGCSFGTGAVYALRLRQGRGVTVIRPSGRVRRFATLTAPGLIDGIAFDESGAFGYRLLVTINHGASTTLDAIDCHGTVSPVTTRAPRVEGGIVVAPRSFGRFSGQLIASDEKSGAIFAIGARGLSRLVASPVLPHGGDIGVESEGFLPARGRFRALLADRRTPGNRHPGDDVLLGLSSSALRAAGARPGDLLVATEGSARTVALSCHAGGCHVRLVAIGPSEAHGEGHIALVPG